MKVDLEIKTGLSDDVFCCKGIYHNDMNFTSVVWKQRLGDDAKDSIFEFKVDKSGALATLFRKGEISSELPFNINEETIGFINSVYGRIPINIKTDYIKVPNVMINIFEVKYTIDNGSGEDVENIVTIRVLT